MICSRYSVVDDDNDNDNDNDNEDEDEDEDEGKKAGEPKEAIQRQKHKDSHSRIISHRHGVPLILWLLHSAALRRTYFWHALPQRKPGSAPSCGQSGVVNLGH